MRFLSFFAPAGRPMRQGGAFLTACLAAALLLTTPVARAGGGDDHDHGHSHSEASAVAAAARPRVAARSEAHDLVAILTGADTLTVYLDRFADNAPVTDATIEVTVSDEPLRAEPSTTVALTRQDDKRLHFARIRCGASGQTAGE
jgi:hypothetical protein